MGDRSSKPAASTAYQAGILLLLLLSGCYVVLFSQASAPDYRRLFWSVVPVALVHFIFGGFYLWQGRGWLRWIVLCMAVVVMAFFGEMTFRVWHHPPQTAPRHPQSARP